MTKPDLASARNALLGAGIEVYRATPAEIQIAERVRLHIMDSGVRVRLDEDMPAVTFTAHSQSSDFPHAEAAELLSLVRSHIGAQATARGYREVTAKSVDVTDPVDGARVLDVWHEIVFEKETPTIDAVVDEVRWALGLDKYVSGARP